MEAQDCSSGSGAVEHQLGDRSEPVFIDRPSTGSPLWSAPAFRFLLFHCLALLLFFTLLRATLAVRFFPGGTLQTADYLLCFLFGAVRDLPVSVALTLPLVLWVCWFPRRWFSKSWHRRLFLVAYGGGWAAQVFLLIAEYFFFDEFKSRFNTVAIDYVLYPHEVFINIWDSYPVPAVLLACAIMASLLTWLSRRLAPTLWLAPLKNRDRWIFFGVSLGMTMLLAWSLRLIPSRVSKERLVSEVANNGLLSLISAAWSRNLDYAAFYPTMPREEAFARTRSLLAEPGSEFITSGESIARRIEGDPTRPRYNVVLFLEESLGSEFFGSLGRVRQTLTPELDKLSQEGLFFVNMYATGNRTVRGLEGILASFPPLPGDSIVKRDRSENVETLARVLQRDGYRTTFLYGGRGAFDGLRSFAVRNGYDEFIEQKDFSKPVFQTIWGVSNEDLYQRTLLECRKMENDGQPFLATVLSVSNHKPYTYPSGRIRENPNARSRRNAVKYTDWALGQFFAAARQERFWTNTIFVVVADHGARVYGSQSIPIHSYEIPFLVLGPAVVKSPGRLPQLGSQLDVAPTILGLLDRPYETMFFGRDLLKTPAGTNRVLVNHNRDIGLATPDRLVVFGLNRQVEHYRGDAKKGTLALVAQPDATDQQIERDATALFQTADDLYMKRRYRHTGDK